MTPPKNLHKILRNGDMDELMALVPDMSNWTACAVGQKLRLKRTKNKRTIRAICDLVSEHDRELFKMGNSMYYNLKWYATSGDGDAYKHMLEMHTRIRRHRPKRVLLKKIRRFQE